MNLIISQIDKANHFIAGTIICSLFMLFIPILYAFLITSCIGIIKEIFDLILGIGTFDIKDILFTIAGTLPLLISHITLHI
jgi:hypothetical protein